MGLAVSTVSAQQLAALRFFRWLFGYRSTLPCPPPALISLPVDILSIVFQILMDIDPGSGLYDEERCMGAVLIPLSETCRHMRATLKPWIYREVYNWCRVDGDVWPRGLWPLFRVLHLRDRSVRHPKEIPLNNALFASLPTMTALARVTLQLGSQIPPDLLGSLSLIPNLTVLEIHQARFDGAAPPRDLAFPSLETLLVSICGFRGVVRASGIDRTKENKNILALLQNTCNRLNTLQISGDLISMEFLALEWPVLRQFSVTEHTPTPYISVPDLVARMPAIRELSVLFSADLTRSDGELYPPFTLGISGGENLACHCPLLNRMTLSNMGRVDPIFRQLPASLESLHLLAVRDHYIFGERLRPPREAAFTAIDVPIVLTSISRLDTLVELTLTLEDFPTAGVIRAVASAQPQLRFLQLGRYYYPHGDVYVEDVRDDAIVEALRELPNLTHLRLALDFLERQYNQEGPQESAARWLMAALPGLRVVEFLWEQGTYWRWVGLDPTRWQPWDRSVLLRGPTPPPRTPSPEDVPIIGEDLGWG
ncbi:hypothetical protein B0H19DRAFT_1194897 [Mycena capillaripes]|nr:hypothetical protein B0H19DRAFT_1194897 [Mycena capillaripes]